MADKMDLIRSLDSFTIAYIECALWSETDNDGDALDYKFDTHSEETLLKMKGDCEKFQKENSDFLVGYPLENAGHDFWLTRNHHGCGFWLNDFGTEENCEKLTKSSHKFGECCLYVGDSGEIYI